jgi:cell division transport system ATP-binding protein
VTAVIRFQNVGLRYGRGPEVLRDINLEIAPGSFQFLTGPSGAGKTSLLRLAFLGLKPDRGLISVFGRDSAGLGSDDVARLRRRMGIVFQDFRLLDHLTVYENVALPLRVIGREERAYRKQVEELVRWVGLSERLHQLPPALSGGEKQRAAIARALIAKPDVLLADEPTGSVDPALADRLLRLFSELPRLGTAVLFATHDIALMNRFDAPRLVIAEGRLFADG